MALQRATTSASRIGAALGEKFVGRERDAEPIEDDARARVRVAAHRVALDLPRERLSEAADDGLGRLGVQAFGIEEHAIEIEEDVRAAAGSLRHRFLKCRIGEFASGAQAVSLVASRVGLIRRRTDFRATGH